MTRFREVEHQRWAKDAPPAEIDLAGSGAPQCPARLLKMRRGDFATRHPAGYGWPPFVAELAARYRVPERRVLPVSGGTSLANWIACAAAMDGAPAGSEAIVERPTYEPLVRAPESLRARVRRLERRFADRFALDVERLALLLSRRTRLLVLSDLHNPSGVRLDRENLVRAAELLARVGGFVLVDEVYLESTWGERTDSAARVAPNVIATNSLTKAYGLDGLRAGWILAPEALVPVVRKINDHLGVNGVATGERMAAAALGNLGAIRARIAPRLARNLDAVRRWIGRDARFSWIEPAGGTVCFPRLPRGVDSDKFAAHLLRRHSTLVVPGRFFETKRHVRVGLTVPTATLERGLRRMSRALDEL